MIRVLLYFAQFSAEIYRGISSSLKLELETWDFLGDKPSFPISLYISKLVKNFLRRFCKFWICFSYESPVSVY